MFTLHEHHRSHLRHMLFSDLNRLFFFRTIFAFSNSMIFVFVPIFLFKTGYSIIDILFYSIIMYAAVILFDPLVVSLIRRIGFKNTLLLALPFSFANYFFIDLATTHVYFVAVAALLQGVHLSLFFTALNAEIYTKGHSKKRGDEIGNLNILVTLAVTISPFIGGFILTYYNYTTLLIVVALIQVVATVPLWLSKDVQLKHYGLTYKDCLRLFRSKDRMTKAFFIFDGADIILLLYVWPVILFLLLKNNLLNFGSLLTITSIISVILLYLIKKQLDKKPKEIYLRMTSKIVIIEYLLKMASFLFPPLVYVVESIAKINRKVLSVSSNAIYFSNASKGSFMDYILMCDLVGRVSRIAFALVLVVLFLIFGESLLVMSLVLGFGVLLGAGFHVYKELT